jgi:hypothetical protein
MLRNDNKSLKYYISVIERNAGTCVRHHRHHRIMQINLDNFLDNIVSINLLFSGLNIEETRRL